MNYTNIIVTEMCTYVHIFVTKLCIVGYGTIAYAAGQICTGSCVYELFWLIGKLWRFPMVGPEFETRRETNPNETKHRSQTTELSYQATKLLNSNLTEQPPANCRNSITLVLAI